MPEYADTQSNWLNRRVTTCLSCLHRWQHCARAAASAVVALACIVAITTVAGYGRPSQPGPPALAATATPRPAAVTVSPASHAPVDPAAGVAVTAVGGTLDHVTMINDQGRPLNGTLNPDRLRWNTIEPLGYATTYTITVASTGAAGIRATRTDTVTTVAPSNQTRVDLRTTGGQPLQDGATYGVGAVVVAHFDEPVTDRVAAEQHLLVTASPPVYGSWYWVDDQDAHWRPEHYWASGTHVEVTAEVYGVALGEGLYGQEDSHTSFTIGDAHVAVADDLTKQVSVYDNGKLVRTMPTSMGRGGSETVAGQTISFWTQPGVYTVLDKTNPVVMDSSTYGLPINSRLGYKESVNYATRISTDGVYLHELDQTVWAQGNTNVSHGCLNLNADNARWFYDFALPGDVVEVVNTGGRPLQLWQDGDWSVPWPQWQNGSALA